MKLGILASHPIQYQAPLFRKLSEQVDLQVYFAHRQTAAGQAAAGFNVQFEWDVDLLSGYKHAFLKNIAWHPGVNTFLACDTPEIASEIRRGRFDAFMVTGWYLKSFWQAILACRRSRVPVMVRGDSQLGTPRGRVKQLTKELLYPRLLQYFDACLYVGQNNQRYLKHYGVPSESLFFSPHCIDNDSFAFRAQGLDRERSRARLNIASEQKAVLFVGKFLEGKRPLDLISALAILRDRGLQVCGVFAGDGPLLAQLKAKSNELNVAVALMGFRNQTELPEAYAVADVLVLPSDGETWGLVVNEALACGTPVVVSNAVGCAPDLVIEGETGSIYPVGDTLALADSIQRVLSSPPNKNAIKRIADSHSVSAAAKGVLDSMVWLMDRKSRMKR